MKKTYILIFISQLLFANTLNLEQILKYATDNAIDLKLKQTDILIESENIKNAKSAYYPTLNVTYNSEYNKALDGSAIGTEYVGGLAISSQTKYQTSIALQLNYDLYHFGATNKQVDINEAEYDIKKTEWCTKEKELHKKILETYADARKVAIEQKYKREMLAIRTQIYRFKERLYKVGKSSKVDLGDEAIQIITSERDLEDLSMKYKDDVLKLSQLCYMEIRQDVILQPITLSEEKKFISSYSETVEGVTLKKKIEQKRDEISLQIREQFPSVGLYSSYYYYGTDPKDYGKAMSNIDKKSWNAGLAVRFNIFEGFKHSSKYERLRLELYHLEQEFDSAKHAYEYELKSKKVKLSELATLKRHDTRLQEQNNIKVSMLNRLRETQKVDSITKLNAEYELLEKTMYLKRRNVEMAFESASLNILQKGIKECAQH